MYLKELIEKKFNGLDQVQLEEKRSQFEKLNQEMKVTLNEMAQLFATSYGYKDAQAAHHGLINFYGKGGDQVNNALQSTLNLFDQQIKRMSLISGTNNHTPTQTEQKNQMQNQIVNTGVKMGEQYSAMNATREMLEQIVIPTLEVMIAHQKLVKRYKDHPICSPITTDVDMLQANTDSQTHRHDESHSQAPNSSSFFSERNSSETDEDQVVANSNNTQGADNDRPTGFAGFMSGFLK